MSKKPEDQIEEKLRQLEMSIKEAPQSNVPANLERSNSLSSTSGQSKQAGISSNSRSNAGSKSDDSTGKGDWHLLGGAVGLVAGFIVLLSHIRIGTLWWSPHYSGGIILLLLIGLGIFFYDFKNKLGWVLTVGSLLAMIVGVIYNLHASIMPMNLLDFILMFTPILLGISLIARGHKLNNQK